jgi:hypothetical protein
VLAVVVGLLLILAVALLILGLVALPQIRSGSRILTPDGGRAVGQALVTARQKPIAAAGGTWRGLIVIARAAVVARRRIAVAWAPVSAVLHEAMDRLEAKSVPPKPVSVPAGEAEVGQEPTAESADQPAEEPVAAPVRRRDRFDVAAIIAGRPVAGPRSAPAVSGPIQRPVGPSAEPSVDQVIDLRADDGRNANREAGAVRHAR